MSAYRRDFDKTKCMSFSIKDNKLFEKYNDIWKKVSNIIKKEFDSKTVYNKIPKEDSQCICLSVILIDSDYKKDKKLLSSRIFRRM